MKILLTGKDNFAYNRTLVLMNGLKALGVELIYFPIEKKKKFDREKFSRLSKDTDLVYIPPFRHSDVKFIKKLSHAPIVFDALISKYLTRTIDHGKWWTTWEKKWRDRVAFEHADQILMDTEHHRRYIIDLYDLDPKKVHALAVGVDTDVFVPKEKSPSEKFIVGFYGGFIPLQGVLKIIEAATLLKDTTEIEFRLIGNGPQFKEASKLLKKLKLNSVILEGWVRYESLNDRINEFDLCLGIFGDSVKTDIVVPNKIYHYAALKKPILTKETVGIREVFDQTQIVTCSNRPDELASTILKLKDDKSLRTLVALNGYTLITGQYNHKAIAKRFLEIFSKTK